MPAIFNFGVFDTQDVTNSDVNLGLAITVSPTFHGKVNEGYGFNVGDFKYVPSYALVIDTDVTDFVRFTPNWSPTASAGV